MKKALMMMVAMVAGMVAAAAPEANAPSAGAELAPEITIDGSPIDIVLQAYADVVHRTVLKDPKVPSGTITLKSSKGQRLTRAEWLEAIATMLEMNGVHLEPYGESFLRAIPRDKARKDGIPLIMDMETQLEESGKVVSMMLQFKHISAEEGQKILEGLKSDPAVLLVFERSNSILVTDTEQNINRMLELIRAVDVENPVTESVTVRQIEHASAADIKSALETIVQESQKELEKNGKQVPAAAQTRNLPGRGLRNQPNNQPAQVNNESLVMSISDADKGTIRGKVVIVADERSNKLIIVTSKANMDFFDKIIAQLDVETTPDTVVKVYRLDYADSEDVADMINDLIGNASSSRSSSKGNQNQNAKNGSGGNITRNTSSPAKKSANQRTGEAKAGELSKENTTVLSDKRINGIVVMTNKDLVPVIEEIIKKMDVKLSQVLIETCIIEVQLTDTINTGIDWVHQINSGPQTLKDGAEVLQGLTGGGGGIDAEKVAAVAAEGAADTSFPVGSGLNYFFLDKGLNIGAVIQASKTDGRTKYVASPVIMTVDNKEATINATGMNYLLKGFTSSGNSYSTIAVPDYEQKELGIEIKVTPKINPNGTVMLTIEEKYSQQSGTQVIKYATGNSRSSTSSSDEESGSSALQDVSVPLTVTREMSADVLLEDRQTVILGGLTDTFISQEETGIPLLKDIPWVGRYLFGKVQDKETRSELLVFLTPYVMDNPEKAFEEAKRRKAVISAARPWDDHGWSQSELADPVSTQEKLNRQKREWEDQDAEHAAELQLESQRRERVKQLKERAEEEASQAKAEGVVLPEPEAKPKVEAKPEAAVKPEVEAKPKAEAKSEAAEKSEAK